MNIKLEFAKRDYSMTYSSVALKSQRREELENEVAEWVARGNSIKPFEKEEKEKTKIKHGTDGTFKKMGCRCKTCVNWARSKGLLITEPMKEKVKVEDKQTRFAKHQQMVMHAFVEAHGESWDYLAARSGYTVTAHHLRRIYEGQSEATLLDWNVLKTTLHILGVSA